MQDTSGVFDFGLAGGVTLAESWTVFESQLSSSGAPGVQREGIWECGAGKGRAELEIPGDVDVVNKGATAAAPPFQTCQELLFHPSVPRSSAGLSAALREIRRGMKLEGDESGGG